MSNDQATILMNAIKELQSKQGFSTLEEFLQNKKKTDSLFNQLVCLERPELKGRTCSLCLRKYDGYGNNPAPLEVEGRVCDDCNVDAVIPARMEDDE